MKRNVAITLSFVFIIIAIVYPTYAIFQSMIEDVRHSLTVFKNAPSEVKQFFTAGGWNIDNEVDSVIDTTTVRNQMGMAFLIIVEILCLGIAMGSMLLGKS